MPENTSEETDAFYDRDTFVVADDSDPATRFIQPIEEGEDDPPGGR